LIGSHLGWGTIAVPSDEPSFVVASGEVDECGSQLFDGVEGPHPQQVLFQGSDEALSDAVVAKAPIDWNHLNADDHEMAPYHAIEDQSRVVMAKAKRAGTTGHSAIPVLEAFVTFMLRRPGLSLRLYYEAIAEAALPSPRTVGRAIQRLPNLGIITVQGDSVYEITPSGDLGG
jgi:hypothetical protein